MAGDQTIRRSGVFVVVPTTDQPIILKKLAWSARVPVSRVVLATESSEVCEPWSTQYANMLRPGEPLRQILGLPDGGSYRLAASCAIDQGKSWMVPTIAAHCALAHGEAVTHKAGEARLLIWGTGAVDLSVADTAAEARVTQQEYHLTTKIDRSRHLFADAGHGGTPVLALVPHGEEAERAAAILGKILAGQPHHIAIVATLADIAAPIDQFLRSGSFVAEAAPPKAEPAAPASASTALKPFEPQPKVEPPAAAPPPPAPEAAPAPAETLRSPRPATARRSVLGDEAASPATSLRLPLIAASALVLLAGAAGAAWFALRDNAPADPVRPPPLTQGGPAPQTQSAAVQQQPSPQQQAGAQGGPAAPALARLVTLSPPSGSSCEAQIYELRPRYNEAAVDVAEAASIQIDGQDICGLAIDAIAPARAKFQPGTGPSVVASKSSATRLVFNPTATRAGITTFPVIQIEEPKPLSIEIKRR
jgi:hypothetical protein